MRSEDIKNYYWHLGLPLPPPLPPPLADAFPQLLIVVNTPHSSVLSAKVRQPAKYLADQGQGQLTGQCQCLHPRRYLRCADISLRSS